MRAPADLQVPFDRVTYRDGQLLTARDLRDDLRANQRLRELHTRHLHGTWGIALGFEVTGAASDTAVHVGPGYAIDAQGRELVLAETLEIPLPDGGSSAGSNTGTVAVFVLVMSYQSDDRLLPRPEVDAVCLGAGLNPRTERPVIAWRTSDNVHIGPEVPLAAVLVSNGALIAPPVLSARRYTARQIRPHVGFATVAPDFKEISGAVAVEVDTSEAGFTTTPTYVVRLDFDLDTPFGQALVELMPFAFIKAAEPTRFEYVIPIRRITPRAVSRPPAPVIKLSWLGFEPVSGCEPHVNPFFFFTLAGLRLDTRLRAGSVLAGRL